MKGPRAGAANVEFVLAFGAMILPVSFAIVFTAQLLWVWHSVNEFTRQGASYATTHCWQSSAGNVLSFMTSNVPPTIDQTEFQNGPVQISVNYFAIDATTGALDPFVCSADCSNSCIPDVVTVSISGYQFAMFVTSLGIPPVVIPNFQTSLPMEGAGCDPEQGICLP